MNGSITSITNLLEGIISHLPAALSADCVVFPPAVYLPLVSQLLTDTPLRWGAQNVYSQDSGAYTGELSCTMLKEFGCRYALIGHSERRLFFAENEKNIAEKFHHVKEHGMIPVLCVGETLQDREKGLTNRVIEKQIMTVFSEDLDSANPVVVAYEPVWAIGTGCTASSEEIRAVHSFIRELLACVNQDEAALIPIIYGGSLNEKNAASIFALPDVDGGLIGGASLDAQKFVEIIECIS